ncbi:c-type cytochrome [Ferruginibacter sp. HRS2-29]|uniref:c-type cytochrome n=1 Tax=Ferruginibacter sp. HRS2-29 TaxID=2487334 RepID=UPI0020CF9C36|nr:cytochrome c [Ferruginibacter sp. HRS2-29]
MKKYMVAVVAIVMAACNNPGEKAGENTVAKGPDGEQLYKVNCSQCHRPSSDFVGPKLNGVEANWKDKKLLYEFVRNSADVIKRDEYARSLFEKYNQSPMMAMPHLSDADIDAILKYCNEN